MITQSGVHIQKIGGVGGTPTAMDIAVHAGRMCRWAGAVWEPNLTHFVFVGLLAYKRSQSLKNMLWGFLHDAHECVTGEVPRPFKCDCMRKEQAALDDRIARQFGILTVDLHIIKQCDIDASHIEAVMLGVPGFAETELRYASDYTRRDKIHDDIEDKELFQRIFGSPFYNNTIDGRESLGVQEFAHVLNLAELGQNDEVLESVLQWGLLAI